MADESHDRMPHGGEKENVKKSSDEDSPSNAMQRQVEVGELALRQDRVHHVLGKLMAVREGTSKRQFMTGAMTTLRSAGIFLKNPSMWPWALAPVLINVVLFVLFAIGFVMQGNTLFLSQWAQPSGAMLVLWWAGRVVSWLLLVLLAYLSAALSTGILSGPFVEVLSQKTEKLLLGDDYVAPPEEPLLKGMLTGAAGALVTTVLYLCIMIPLLLLNLIPGVGSVVYFLAAASVGGFFLSIQNTDMALARRGYTLGSQLKLLKSYRPLSLGFGMGASALMLIPVVNLLCVPLVVIAGTAVGVELHDRKRLGSDDLKK